MNSPDDLDVAIIRRAWNRATSASPEQWTKENPARGQCAISAMIVQDCLGGQLIRCLVTPPGGEPESHYANLIEHGVIIDITAGQFPEDSEFGAWEERTREYVTSFAPTVERYMTLVRRLNELHTLDRVAAA